MEPIKFEKNANEISWADYFDQLVHEAWVEARKQESLGIHVRDIKLPESGKHEPFGVTPD